jgi:hypothetical protein
MDPKLKKEWIKQLRSGQYKQGRCRLRSPRNEFCCLGVLADIIGSNEWTSDNTWRGGRDSNLGDEITGLSVQTQGTLIDMNDLAEDDFKTIAKWIRINL